MLLCNSRVTVALTLSTTGCQFILSLQIRCLVRLSSRVVIMNAQKDKVTRELDTNIYKIMDSYRQLLKKGQVNSAGEVSTHEELQIATAATSIVSYLNSIYAHIPLLLSYCYYFVCISIRATMLELFSTKFTICGCICSYKPPM